jgi:hypothetical protein
MIGAGSFRDAELTIETHLVARSTILQATGRVLRPCSLH